MLLTGLGMLLTSLVMQLTSLVINMLLTNTDCTDTVIASDKSCIHMCRTDISGYPSDKSWLCFPEDFIAMLLTSLIMLVKSLVILLTSLNIPLSSLIMLVTSLVMLFTGLVMLSLSLVMLPGNLVIFSTSLTLVLLLTDFDKFCYTSDNNLNDNSL